MQGELEKALCSWRRFLEAEPWLRIDSDAIFQVDDDRSGESYYASILGGQGMLCGLALSRGEEGLRAMGALVQQDVDFEQALTTSTSICMTRHGGPIPRWYRDFLGESLARKRGFASLPLLFVNEAAQAPRPPKVDEVRLLADALGAIAALVERDALKRPVFEPGRPMPCLRLRVEGSGEITERTPEFQVPQVERYQARPDFREALLKLPRLDRTDLVSCHLPPALVKDRKVRMLPIAEAERDRVLLARPGGSPPGGDRAGGGGRFRVEDRVTFNALRENRRLDLRGNCVEGVEE